MHIRGDIYRSDDMTLVRLGPTTVGLLWGMAAELLAKAPEQVPPTCADGDRVLAHVMAGRMQLWVARRDGGDYFAAMLTEILQYDTATVFNLVTLAGEDLPALFAFWPMVERWAKREGAQWCQFVGRPGLARVMARLGFMTPHVYAVKGL